MIIFANLALLLARLYDIRVSPSPLLLRTRSCGCAEGVRRENGEDGKRDFYETWTGGERHGEKRLGLGRRR